MTSNAPHKLQGRDAFAETLLGHLRNICRTLGINRRAGHALDAGPVATRTEGIAVSIHSPITGAASGHIAA